MLDKAMLQRLERKAAGVRALFEQTSGDWEGPTYCNVGDSFGAFSNCCTDPSEGRENYHDSCYA